MTPYTRRTLIETGLGILAVLVFLAGAYWTFTAPLRAKKEAAVAQATATTAGAGMKAAQDSIKITVDAQQVKGRIDLVTQGNRDAILATSGASDALGSDLHDTGLRTLCLRPTYRGLQPACERLFDADPSNAAQ